MKHACRQIFILLSVWILSAGASFGQKKILQKLFSNEKDTTRSSSFLPLPALGYSQETGLEFGVLTLYSFYTDREDTLTRNSSVTGVATYTTKNQVNLLLRTDYWTPQNRFHLVNDIRYRDFPFNYYGIGNQTRQADLLKVTQKLFRFAAEAEKKFGRSSFTGITANFENYRFTYGDELVDRSIPSPTVSEGKVLYLGLSQILDSRNSNTYTTGGTYLKLNYAYAPDIFGAQNFNGSLTKLDLRTFKSLNALTVLGFNANYQTLQGSITPFYLMPQLGNDQIMRGYYAGRFRDVNLLAAQAELRYRFKPRFGVAGFLGGGTVYSNNNLRLNSLKPSYGGGFRYFFDVERGLSIRVDYGVGEKRTGEERQTGVYISLGEAF